MQHPTLRRLCVAAPLTAALGLAACGGGSDSGGTGALTLDLSDAKVDDAAAVNVVFTGLVLQPADGERIAFDCSDPELLCDDPADPEDDESSRTINLMDYEGDESITFLDDAELPAGRYDWIRLLVDAAEPAPGSSGASSIVLIDGSVHDLVVPSGRQTGLKLVSGFDILAGGTMDMTIEFELRKAITLTGNGRYMLRPALRLVDNSNAGHLFGEITNAHAQDRCPDGWSFSDGEALTDGLAVYVYQGPGAEPGDLGGDNAPFADDMARLDLEGGHYDYRIGFLPAGEYTAALVCNPTADDEEVGGDELQIADTVDVNVEPAPPKTELNFGSVEEGTSSP